ncbi:MAG: hypothetical protein IT538_07000 [Variibacter sp.]|nr:hypothetical protein [Variibacter sp.]
MAAESVQSFIALAIGFSVAGLTASGYQLWTARPLSFRLLSQRARAPALAAVPLLVFGAPFVIMRNTVRGRRIEGRPATFVTLATIIAGLWSLMSGTVVASGWVGLIRMLA